MRTFTMSLLAALVAATMLTAAQPQVGEMARDFSLNTMGGKKVQLSSELGGGPVVLLVLRGFPGYQCPVCNRQVQDFLRSAQAFADANAKVIMVYPGPPAELKTRAEEFFSDKQIPGHFTVLIDPGYEFTNLYDLRWDAPRETAYPSTFLLDKTGKIFFAKISDTHGGRTTAEEVIGRLNK